jgi:hypothetical protein
MPVPPQAHKESLGDGDGFVKGVLFQGFKLGKLTSG